jgi:very-short-patch-repair endonuclease
MKKKNIGRCRSLRRTQTDVEKKLWLMLRNRQVYGLKFRRQFPVSKYILDFYCPECKLGVEADGSQHYDEKYEEYDKSRTRELNKLRITIIRFSDLEILGNIEGVCELIHNVAEEKKSFINYGFPLTPPLPEGERGK